MCNLFRRSRLVRLLLISVLTMSLVIPVLPPADAATAYQATGKIDSKGGVYLRAKPSPSAKKLKVIKDNTKVTITGEVFTSKTNTAKKKRYYAVKVSGKTGYVRSDLIDTIKYTTVRKATTAKLYYRVGPNGKMKHKGYFKKGATIQVVLKARVNGVKGTWYKVKTSKGYYYVSSAYVGNVKTSSVSKTSANKAVSTSKLQAKKANISVDGSSIKVTGLRYPVKMTAGQPFSVMGTLTNSRVITFVKAGVVNSSGKWATAAASRNSKTSFDLFSLDAGIRFGSLKAGSYTYKVYATTGGKTYCVASFPFKVVSKSSSSTSTSTAAASASSTAALSSASTTTSSTTSTDDSDDDSNVSGTSANTTVSDAGLVVKKTDVAIKGTGIRVEDLRYPVKLAVGSPFSVMGTVTSSGTTIDSVKVGVVNSSGKWVTSSSAKCGDTMFDIFALDSKIRFGGLSKGTYRYKVIVTAGGKNYTAGNFKFTVIKLNGPTKLAKTAIQLAWPVGTAKKKYLFSSGKAYPAYTKAMDKVFPSHNKWGRVTRVGASCDVFVSTVCRYCGYDTSMPTARMQQAKYLKKSSKWKEIKYHYKESELQSGDIIIYRRNNGHGHICFYVKVNGKGCLIEAAYKEKFGYVNTSIKKALDPANNVIEFRVYRAVS